MILYGRVDYETDPHQVLARVQAARQEYFPYDAIIFDIFMPGKSGLEILKELGDEAPAAVISTGSIMFAEVADLHIQMDSYTRRH